MEIFVEKLKIRLEQPLPGKDAHFKMASTMRNIKFPKPDLTKIRQSGVLLLLYPQNEQPWIVFIKRTEDGKTHGGQISFPGGKFEVKDTSIIRTALRESEEEIGINASDVKIIGSLSQLFIPVSQFCVNPVIGYISYKPSFKPNLHEVQEIIEIPLKSLFSAENRSVMDLEIRGNIIQAPYFNANNHKIWGATAMILNEFLEIIDGLPV